jgi:multidrug efflux pump subunit AcrA (membrane-fusion protein)
VSKVLTDQARARTTFDLAQQEAERIAAQARREAEEALDRARTEAEAIRSAARREQEDLRAVAAAEPPHGTAAPPIYLRPSDYRPSDQRPSDQRPGRRDHEVVNGQPGPPGTPVALGAHRAAPRRLAAWAAQSGGFMLPCEYFLMAHDGSGRARIDQSVLETGLAGAVLCELVRTGRVGLDDGRLTATAHPTGPDRIGEYVLRSLINKPITPVKSWLREHRRDLFVRLAQELADAGAVLPVTRSWPRSGVAYKPADEALANGPAVRLVRFLVDTAQPPDEETYLLGALVDTTGLHRVLPVGVRPREVRDLMSRMLVDRPVSVPLQAVLEGINAAVASIVLSPRGR